MSTLADFAEARQTQSTTALLEELLVIRKFIGLTPRQIWHYLSEIIRPLLAQGGTIFCAAIRV